MNPCIECGKNFCGAMLEGKECKAMHYGKAPGMTQDKLNEITTVVCDAVEDFLDMDKYGLLNLLVSLHNELYKEVTGNYYDYMFHWANLGYGGDPDDGMFKEESEK